MKHANNIRRLLAQYLLSALAAYLISTPFSDEVTLAKSIAGILVLTVWIASFLHLAECSIEKRNIWLSAVVILSFLAPFGFFMLTAFEINNAFIGGVISGILGALSAMAIVVRKKRMNKIPDH